MPTLVAASDRILGAPTMTAMPLPSYGHRRAGPLGADCVVMREHVMRDGNWVQLRERVRPGPNIRRTGEDLPAEALLVDARQPLTPGRADGMFVVCLY